MVLYMFVVAYVGGADEPLRAREARRRRAARRRSFAAALLVEIAIAVVGSGLDALDTRAPSVEPRLRLARRDRRAAAARSS